jgi:hypothetical protein
MMVYRPSDGTFVDDHDLWVFNQWGFSFSDLNSGITEDIECVDLNGQGIDTVMIGNTGGLNQLYVRR